MFLEITEDAQHLACDEGRNGDRAREAVDLLLRVHREGKHIVYLDEALPALERHTGLSKAGRATIASIRSKRAELAGLRRSLRAYTEVRREDCHRVVERSGRSIHQVGMEWFAHDVAGSLESVMLCENTNDAQLYFKLAEARAKSLKWNVKLNAEHRGGGGSTTAQELSCLRDGHRMVICIVDSDQDYPGAPIGDTAARALEVACDARALFAVHMIGAREIENLIPIRLLLETCGAQDAGTRSALALLDEASRQGAASWYAFVDLKRGLVGHDMDALESEGARAFWSAASLTMNKTKCPPSGAACANRGACTCVLIKGLGNAVVPRLVALVAHITPQKMAEICRFDNNASLADTVDAVIAFACCLPRTRT